MSLRTAKILGRIDLPKIDQDYLDQIIEEGTNLHNYIKSYVIEPEIRNLLESLCQNVYDFGFYATTWIGPHIDEGVIGDISLGIIITGDHFLFTGNGRRIGDLVPGTVFTLMNKKTHGALQKDKNSRIPLIFAVCEPYIAIEEWKYFCYDLEKKLKTFKLHSNLSN